MRLLGCDIGTGGHARFRYLRTHRNQETNRHAFTGAHCHPHTNRRGYSHAFTDGRARADAFADCDSDSTDAWHAANRWDRDGVTLPSTDHCAAITDTRADRDGNAPTDRDKCPCGHGDPDPDPCPDGNG